MSKIYTYQINHPNIKGTIQSSHASIYLLLKELSSLHEDSIIEV